MAQIFSRATNTLAPLTFYGAPLAVLLIFYVWYIVVYSQYNTEVGVAPAQPIPFSHEHHVGGLGIDCRYCHTSVEKSAVAGVPATEICMQCHSQIWRDSPVLEPVRASYRTGEPIAWNRVHDLPNFVFFNHSIHVQKGVGCESCHGRVDQMPSVYKANSLYMQWCLDCHDHPEDALRDPKLVYAFDVTAHSAEERQQMAEQHDVGSRTLSDCSVCHR